MMPKTSVSPAAIRNSITPYCRPLSVCSSTRPRVIATRAPGERKGARPSRAPRSAPRAWPLPLHRALGRVGILVVLEDGLLDLHHELAARILHGLQEVEVLDREVVHVVLVRPAGRLVVGLAHRRDHALLVREIALHGLDGRVDQHDPVVTLGAVERRRLAELLLVVRDVLLVRVVLEIGAPVARLELA